MTTTVSAKGQVTLPKQVRDATGIQPGDKVEVRVTGDPTERSSTGQVMTLVDTNVIADVLTADPVWLVWSTEQLSTLRLAGRLLINEVTYAELAARFDTEAELARTLAVFGIVLDRAPTSALFSAGRAFARYRAAGGPRTSLLPDFFIGAHAQVVLTRDVRRYRSYFPDVPLIAPEDNADADAPS